MASQHRSMAVWMMLLLALSTLPLAAATPGYEESFREGVRAGDLKKWQQAAARMADAIAENPTESKKRIALSGVFSAPYIPHFYRGWYLYQQGADQCEESLRELEISHEQGVILTFKKQLTDLQQAREICGARVLPRVIAAAEKKITEIERRLSTPPPPDASALRQRWLQAREKLESARASLEAGRRDSRLRSIQHAAVEAEAVAETVAEIERQTAAEIARDAAAEISGTSTRQATELLEVAEREAEQALDLAERERRALTEALAGHASDQTAHLASLEDVAGRLKALRQALPAAQRASDLAAVQKLREEAESLRSRLEQSRQALADTAEDTEEVAATADEPPEPEQATPAKRETRTDFPIRPDPNLVSEIRRLTESAELFLDRVGADASDSALLELQRSRLSNLAVEARGHSTHGDATASALEALLGRLSDSLAALQLIAGTQAYFAGNPQQAVELLSANDPPASSLGAHFHLLLSASHFALFQVGLLENTGLAGADARRCRQLDPALAPDPRAFSPSFRQFFADAVAQ